MNKFIFLIILCLSTSCSFVIAKPKESMCPYRPAKFIESNNWGQFAIGSEKISEEHKRGVIQVFNYYGKSVNERNGKLYIPCEIFGDLELLVNYTKKSVDSNWLYNSKK
ncbi:hypothetical protein [Agarilytica rhodophyticola]|uniref:hypothetical protein n=1 Tax=Agarilytica rhodophyticola TaxID=1737490 RepID=UPI000B347DB6|nr:hypothetical protein [Agarilytica rhodophyticola]